MDYLDLLDETSFENSLVEAEERWEWEREERQLKYLEEKEKRNGN